jgi:hypothetical protein
MAGAWKRTDWNDIISRVNSLAANPPADTDCEPVPPLSPVGPNHVWTKTDISQVRDKLREICSDTTWSAELRLWTQELVDELNAAIDAGWCNCEPEEECRPDCSNALGSVTTYSGSYTASGCLVLSGGPDGATAADIAAINSASGAANAACNNYAQKQTEACIANDELEVLEDELEVFEAELDAAIAYRDAVCGAGSDPVTCAEAQQQVDWAQQDVDDKQQEVDEKRAERDGLQAEANDFAEAADEHAAACIDAYSAISTQGGVQAVWTSFVPEAEWADRTCADMGPACLSRDPSRCRPRYWSVSRRTIQYFVEGGSISGSWAQILRGMYTPSGKPYITSTIAVGDSNGVPVYACGAFGPNACWNGCYPTAYRDYEVRYTVAYPNPQGEECC